MHVKRTFAVRLPDDLIEGLERIAAEEFNSVGGIIRKALSQFISDIEKAREQPELFNAGAATEDDDEMPLAVNFSQQPAPEGPKP